MTLAEKIYKEALDLPVEDRLSLIDKLIISTNLPTRKDIDKAWSKEVYQRFRQLESGKSTIIPGEEVFDKVKKKFSKSPMVFFTE